MHLSRPRAVLSALLSLSLLLASCVKEDRYDCPCRLSVDLSSYVGFTDRMTLYGWHSGQEVFGCSVLEDAFAEPYEVDVPRGVISYCAWCGAEGMGRTDDALLVVEGKDCAPLFAYGASVATVGERAYDKVLLRKQHCRVTLSLSNVPSPEQGSLEVLVRSRWSGLALPSLEALQGSFRYCGSIGEEGECEFLLPRQGDDSIEADILLDSQAVFTIPLGRLIAEKGYDWSAEDLDDVWVSVDWGLGEAHVSILGWTNGWVHEEEI